MTAADLTAGHAVAIREALMVDNYGSPPRHTKVGQEALTALAALVADHERLTRDNEALRAVSDAAQGFLAENCVIGGGRLVEERYQALRSAVLAPAGPEEQR